MKQTLLTNTKFPKSVRPPNKRMLKPGSSNKKLGARVRKGMWRGFPIFSLTLEERATCPAHCEQWDNCYGNNMPFAHRFNHNSIWFETELASELAQLSMEHEQGFVVRLHVLGDFYSEEYVKFWFDCLVHFPQLNVFGYTHHRHTDPIGRRIQNLNTACPTRWRVRFSDDPTTEFRAEVVASMQQAKGIVCPEQQGKANSCAECAYCWHSEKPIYFLEH